MEGAEAVLFVCVWMLGARAEAVSPRPMLLSCWVPLLIGFRFSQSAESNPLSPAQEFVRG